MDEADYAPNYPRQFNKTRLKGSAIDEEVGIIAHHYI